MYSVDELSIGQIADLEWEDNIFVDKVVSQLDNIEMFLVDPYIGLLKKMHDRFVAKTEEIDKLYASGKLWKKGIDIEESAVAKRRDSIYEVAEDLKSQLGYFVDLMGDVEQFSPDKEWKAIALPAIKKIENLSGYIHEVVGVPF
jgi:hypothetical protein